MAKYLPQSSQRGLDLNPESWGKEKAILITSYNSTSWGVLLFKMSHAADAFGVVTTAEKKTSN